MKINGVSVLAARIEGANAESLREAADQYKSKLGEAVIVLGAQVADDKVSLVSSVSPATSKKVSAGALIGEVAKLVGGRGGGRPDFRAGGRKRPVEARRGPAGRAEAGRREARRNLTRGLPVGGYVGVFDATVLVLLAGAEPLPDAVPNIWCPAARAAVAHQARGPRARLRHRGRTALRLATRLDKIGRIWAPVAINGEGPFRLVLATGASHTALTPHLAETLGIQADPAD